ncbi:MAG TPA: HEAT repeat domain-containing protein [Tepidisphaeraceae bacterium]|nr:HEAT repeat domain-containing protein [Tepidisphaeraceae bacterium]
MASRILASVCISALGLSGLLAGCADPSAAPTTYAAMAPVGSPAFQEDHAGAAKYRGQPDVYFSTYTVAEDDREPANPFFAKIATVSKAVGKEFDAFGHFCGEEFRWYVKGQRPITAVRMMNDPHSADNRRAGINMLLTYNFTKRPPYTTRFRQLSAFDEDPTVRAVAIRASNRARDIKATPLFVAALSDKSELVRLEAAKALVHLPDPAAERPLIRTLQDTNEDLDVRIAAADALKHYHDVRNAQALAEALDDKDFSVVWQARRSLVYLTGRDFGYDDGAWLNYFAGPDKPFG